MALPKTDDFNGTPGTALHTYNAGWTQRGAANASISDGTGTGLGVCATGSDSHCTWDGDGSYNDDQYAQCNVAGETDFTHNYEGPSVRVSGTSGAGTLDGYMCYSSGSVARLARIDNGLVTNLQAGPTTTNTPVYRIEAEGTAIRGYVSGTLFSGGAVTDATYASGAAGFYVAQGSAAAVDNWEGGNLGGGGGGGVKHVSTLTLMGVQ